MVRDPYRVANSNTEFELAAEYGGCHVPNKGACGGGVILILPGEPSHSLPVDRKVIDAVPKGRNSVQNQTGGDETDG